MRGVVAFALVWSLACAAFAQPLVPPFVEPGTQIAHEPSPPVGACIGGSCGASKRGPPMPRPRSTGRLARGAAIAGAVAAGLSLGGAVAIAVVDDLASERITRGLWVGTVGLATPLVAFAAYRARRSGAVRGIPSARRLGWVAYGAAVSQGALQWALAMRGTETSRGLTIAAGGFGALALLPHAFDALVSARGARTATRRAQVSPGFGGFSVRF